MRKLNFVILPIIFGLLFSFQGAHYVQAEIGDIGHWRDSIGNQIPGLNFSAFNFDSEIQNDGIYTRPNASTIQLNEAGDYLIIATTRDVDNSNGRYNSQANVVQTSGTGNVFTSHYSGYSRDTSENNSWNRALGVVIGASANSQIQIQRRRDTDAPTGGSIAGESDVQVVRINPTNHGIYQIGGTGNTFGGTVPNTVGVDSVNTESDISAIEADLVNNNITIKGDNKRYLVAWSTSFINSGNRSQRIGHLEYDGVDELPTRSYCYRRNASNEYCGLGSMDIIETGTADISLQVEVFRGPGIGPDDGGADTDEGLLTDGNGQLMVLEMPDSLEVFRSHDSVGLQSVTAPQTLNIARDLDFNDALSFTRASNNSVNVTNPADIFSWANIWTARNNVASGARQTSFGSITINGIEQSIGEHGNYSRGNQGTTDTFGLSFHPAGIFNIATAGDNIGVNTDPLAGGEGGGVDRTQPDTLGFFALNLDTLVAPLFEQSSYRFFENTDTTDVGAALAAQDTPAVLSSDGASFRLRALVGVSDNQLRQNEQNFSLQFAERSGICDAGFAGETYANVTTTSAIAFNNNPTPADGESLSANPNDPINGLNVIVNQSYEEANNFTNSQSTIGEDQSGKWDFSLIDNTAPNNTTYCFRIIESNGDILDTYSRFPEITTADDVIAGIAPGGNVNALNLWLRTDRDVFTDGGSPANDGDSIRSWSDQSLGGFDATEPNAGDADNVLFNANSDFNFNPSIEFDGTAVKPLANAAFTRANGNELSYFVVARSDTQLASGNAYIESNDNNSRGFFLNNRYNSNVNYSASLPLGEITLGSINDSGALANADLIINGFVTDSFTKEFNSDYTNGRYTIGDDDTGGNRLDGEIAEVIMYDEQKIGIERDEIESYLALKYGITLDQSVPGGKFYYDSTGSIYWNVDVNNIYENDIFGIGRDDATELDQRVSRSSNSDSVITLALDNDFISSNVDPVRSTTHANDLQFLTLANDNNPLTLQTTEIDARFQERIGREWQIQKTANFTQTTNLKFDGFNDDYNLLMDVDGDFSTGAVDLGQLDANGEITNIDLFNTQHITLAKNNVVAPQELSFNVFDADANNTVGFNNLSLLNARFATSDENGSATPIFSSNVTASTNAANGYIIEIDGTNLVCTSCDPLGPFIDGIGTTATASNPGTEQFGLRAAVASGTATVAAPYNDPINHAYETSLFVDEFVTGTGDNTLADIPLEFIANINPLTPAGEYTATLTFTMHAEF